MIGSPVNPNDPHLSFVAGEHSSVAEQPSSVAEQPSSVAEQPSSEVEEPGSADNSAHMLVPAARTSAAELVHFAGYQREHYTVAG